MIWLKKVANKHFSLWICCGLCFSVNAWSWSFVGHAALTEQVFQHLEPPQQAYYVDLVRALDRRDQNSLRIDLGSLGTWPDRVRDKPLQTLLASQQQQVPALLRSFESSSTSRWHYVNQFVGPEKRVERCNTRNRGQLLKAMQTLDRVLFDRQIVLTRSQEAMILSFQLHLLQDLHQPLHTFARLDNKCRHDRGGNMVCLQQSRKCELNLHQYWDAGFGWFHQLEQLEPIAPAERAFKPEQWARQNLEMVDVVYPGLSAAASSDFFSDEYRKKAKGAVQQQLVLTQARSLDYLQRYFLFKKHNGSHKLHSEKSASKRLEK